MNIVIYDDDKLFLNYLYNFILLSPYQKNITLATNDYAVLKRHLIFVSSPTIFLLDIVCEQKTIGFEITEMIQQRLENFAVVFITNYPDRIMENTVHKLKAMNVVLKSSNSFEKEILTTLNYASQTLLDKEEFFIHEDKFSRLQLAFKGIYFISTVKGKNAIILHHEKGIFEIKKKPLNELINELPYYFIRCHNSYIVNVNKIMKIDFKNSQVILQNGMYCDYSVSRKKHLLNKMKELK